MIRRVVIVTGKDMMSGEPITLEFRPACVKARWPGYDEKARRFRDERGRFKRSPWRRVTRIELGP